jgi:hypothetical protein
MRPLFAVEGHARVAIVRRFMKREVEHRALNTTL